MNYRVLFFVATSFLLSNISVGQDIPKYKTTGTIERIDPALDQILSKDAKVEIIAEGFDWSEGPVWIQPGNMLLFSDVPQNIIYKWTEQKGKEIYLTPSGYTDSLKRSGEMGSNGLVLDPNGQLVLCQHGNRQMARMNAPINAPQPKFISVANNYQGKKFNSPNDAVYSKLGELFFTDPPYGLEKRMDDPKKEISFQGVYKVKKNGDIILLADSITRPNGIAFMPGEKTLIVSNSDPDKPFWYAFDINNDKLSNPRIFYSATGFDSTREKGLPDGLKIDKKGNVFAAGPGGVWIFNSKGKLLGKIKLTDAASNCAFSPDQKTLYVTNDMNVLRIKLK
ncbi:MAG TPA: SMP-30/gluconolactonase/LRE family protein [Chitinophagaceae bacterium]